MSGLRIVYVSPRYYPHVGGVEYVVRNFAERLASRGNDVTVISGEPDIKKTMIEEVNKVEVVRIPTYAPKEAYHIPKDMQTVTDVLEGHLDIVHTHSVHAVISFLPLRIKKSTRPNWKLIMTMHCSTLGYTFLRRFIWRFAWKHYVARYLKHADSLHVTSPREASIVSEFFPSVKKRILTIPIGINEDVMNYEWKGVDSDYLLYSGRLERYKRIDLMVKTISRLVKRGYSLRLVVTGSGSHRNEIIEEARREMGKAADRFVVVGPPRLRREYLELLSRARAAISLSMSENFNIFLAEAYMIGVPIIATCEAAAFLPEKANVKNLNPDHIADAILNKLRNPDRKDYEHNLKTWPEVVKEIQNAYRSLIYA